MFFGDRASILFHVKHACSVPDFAYVSRETRALCRAFPMFHVKQCIIGKNGCYLSVANCFTWNIEFFICFRLTFTHCLPSLRLYTPNYLSYYALFVRFIAKSAFRVSATKYFTLCDTFILTLFTKYSIILDVKSFVFRRLANLPFNMLLSIKRLISHKKRSICRIIAHQDRFKENF